MAPWVLCRPCPCHHCTGADGWEGASLQPVCRAPRIPDAAPSPETHFPAAFSCTSSLADRDYSKCSTEVCRTLTASIWGGARRSPACGGGHGRRTGQLRGGEDRLPACRELACCPPKRRGWTTSSAMPGAAPGGRNRAPPPSSALLTPPSSFLLLRAVLQRVGSDKQGTQPGLRPCGAAAHSYFIPSHLVLPSDLRQVRWHFCPNAHTHTLGSRGK